MADLRMPDINRVEIAGRLTRDPDVRALPNGTRVMEFNIAYDQRVKKGDGWDKEGHFFQCKAWDKVADTCERLELAKGVPVIIEGKLLQEKWVDREEKKRSKTRITVYRVQRLDWAERGRPAQPEDNVDDEPDGDMPF